MDDGNKMMRSLIIYLLLILSYSICQSSNYGGGPNSFYQNLYTSREAAMGGVGIASADSYIGYLWNPAAIINIFSNGENLVSGMHTSFNLGGLTNFNDNHEYGMSGQAISWGGFGLNKRLRYGFQDFIFSLGILHRQYADVMNTSLNVNNEIVSSGSSNYNENLLMLSAAHSLKDWSYGFLVKYNHNNISINKNLKYGFDLGLLKNYLSKTSSDGSYYFNNLGFTVKYDRDNQNSHVRFGVGNSLGYLNRFDSKKIKEEKLKNKVGKKYLIAYDVVSGKFIDTNLKIGLEYEHHELNAFYFRLGVDLINTFDKIRSYSAGGGLYIQKWSLIIDLSYTSYLDSFDGINYLLVDSPIKLSFTFKK